MHCVRDLAHRAKPASILLVAEAVRNEANVLPSIEKGRKGNQRPGGEQLREPRGPFDRFGHEIAHATAGYPNARLSSQYATQAGLQAVNAFLEGQVGGSTRTIMALLGLGSQVGILLPFSRSQEQEADILGLQYMAGPVSIRSRAFSSGRTCPGPMEKSPRNFCPLILRTIPGFRPCRPICRKRLSSTAGPDNRTEDRNVVRDLFCSF